MGQPIIEKSTMSANLDKTLDRMYQTIHTAIGKESETMLKTRVDAFTRMVYAQYTFIRERLSDGVTPRESVIRDANIVQARISDALLLPIPDYQKRELDGINLKILQAIEETQDPEDLRPKPEPKPKAQAGMRLGTFFARRNQSTKAYPEFFRRLGRVIASKNPKNINEAANDYYHFCSRGVDLVEGSLTAAGFPRDLSVSCRNKVALWIESGMELFTPDDPEFKRLDELHMKLDRLFADDSEADAEADDEEESSEDPEVSISDDAIVTTHPQAHSFYYHGFKVPRGCTLDIWRPTSK